jgi:hypothetical protein
MWIRIRVLRDVWWVSAIGGTDQTKIYLFEKDKKHNIHLL